MEVDDDRSAGSSAATYRNAVTFWMAWAGGLGLLVLSVAVDFLHLDTTFEPPDQDATFVEGLRYYGVLCAAACVFLVSGIRPKVVCGTEGLDVYNMFRTVWIPWGVVQEIETSGKYPKVLTDDGNYNLWGLERLNVPIFDPGAGLTGYCDGKARSSHAMGTPRGHVRVCWRGFDIVDIAYIAPWLVYAVAAGIATYYGLSPASFA